MIEFDPILVHEWLARSAQRTPDKCALVCEKTRWTYAALQTKVEQFACALIELGLQRQERVVTFMDNSAETLISMYGTLTAAGVSIIAANSIKANKLQYMLEDSKARVLVCHVSKAKIVAEALQTLGHTMQLIWVGDKRGMPDTLSAHSAHWDDLFESVEATWADRGELSFPRQIDVDLAMLIYTSGSTGKPKGVMSTHHNVVCAARSIIQYLKNEPDDVIMNVLPLSFDCGLYQVIMNFMYGGTVILEKSFLYMHNVLTTIVNEQVTGFPIMPTITAMLLRLQDLGQYDLSSVRYMTNTGAALPPEHIQEINELFPWITMFSMFGLTECKRVGYLPPELLEECPTSVGIAMPNCEVRVVDEQGAPVPAEETGQLVVRGSNVMQGYWNDPELSNHTFRPGQYPADRILFSGDYFHMDEKGRLYFEGRRDDIIKCRGERINTLEVESGLLGIQGIAEAAVIGVPDEVFVNVIKAFVVLDGNVDLDENEIRKQCTGLLEAAMVPKYVEVVTDLPRNTNGKVDKKQLKGMELCSK